MKFSDLTPKQQKILSEVAYLYTNSERFITHWLWNNHVQIVARNAIDIATKYKANTEYVFAGALLHDLADIWMERDNPRFERKSRDQAKKILKDANFDEVEILFILDKVINPHSCRTGNLPQTIEGKTLATADALAHISTSFYHDFKKMGYPQYIKADNFNKWAQSKLERDYQTKIFFDEERKQAKTNYLKLKTQFS